MGLRCYVAGKWEEKKRVREIQDWLKLAGHTITWDWTRNEKESRIEAIRDLRGVADADVFVIVLEKPLRYAGAYVELGAALALGKPVYVLGDASKTLFLKHPHVRRGEAAFNRDLIAGSY